MNVNFKVAILLIALFINFRTISVLRLVTFGYSRVDFLVTRTSSHQWKVIYYFILSHEGIFFFLPQRLIIWFESPSIVHLKFLIYFVNPTLSLESFISIVFHGIQILLSSSINLFIIYLALQ
jgi:hypothetical protein